VNDSPGGATAHPPEGSGGDPPNGSAADSPNGSTVPQLRLARGSATPEELAAVVAVLSAASGADDPPAPRPTSRWVARDRLVRRPLTPGRGAWRASAWPG
jgi:hypothetical protein